MIGLILDTASNLPFLLLAEEGKPLAFAPLEGGEKLSRNFGALVKDFLGEKVPDFIAAGRGPGSYTGVRVGTAMAKALAFGWNIPLASFPSLQAFAPDSPEPFAILFDARMGGLYCQRGLASDFSPPELLQLSKAPSALAGLKLFSPHRDSILQKTAFPQGILPAKPNAYYLSEFCFCLPRQSPLEPLELAYLDGKT